MPSTGARLDVPESALDRRVGRSTSPSTTQSRPISTASVESRFGRIALLVSAASVALAAVGVRRVSLWVDESYTVSVATRSPADVWRMVHTIDIVHALYNTMLHPWFHLVGVSELTVRLPSLVAVGGPSLRGRGLRGTGSTQTWAVLSALPS